ncbi:MAG: energy-coupling factor ABC transporter permease [Bacteroidota bacterium]|nr:energy-coupling factor ABC transporter permease [Bacteroidota bacterium]
MLSSLVEKKKRHLWCLLLLLVAPHPLWAMHIAEGFLPLPWCISWYIVIIPFLLAGLYSIRKKIRHNPRIRLLLGIAGGLTFLLSALKLPSITGSCSHMTGTGLGAVLFGPFVMTVVGMIVLLFQALLMAHGGITTLGANTFSMAVAGPLVAYMVYKVLAGLKSPQWLSVFMAAFLSDLATYAVTAGQLAWAFPGDGGVMASFVKFITVFAYTQLPLAVIEGVISVGVFNFLQNHSIEELKSLSVVKPVSAQSTCEPEK